MGDTGLWLRPQQQLAGGVLQTAAAWVPVRGVNSGVYFASSALVSSC